LHPGPRPNRVILVLFHKPVGRHARQRRHSKRRTDAIAEQPLICGSKTLSWTLRAGQGWRLVSKALPSTQHVRHHVSWYGQGAGGFRPVGSGRRLTGYLNCETDTRKQIRSALTYPIVMVLMADCGNRHADVLRSAAVIANLRLTRCDCPSARRFSWGLASSWAFRDHDRHSDHGGLLGVPCGTGSDAQRTRALDAVRSTNAGDRNVCTWTWWLPGGMRILPPWSTRAFACLTPSA
jgi:hypothetical protein